MNDLKWALSDLKKAHKVDPTDIVIRNEIIKVTEEYKRRRKNLIDLDEISNYEIEDNYNSELIVEFIGNFEKLAPNTNETKKKKKNKKRKDNDAKNEDNNRNREMENGMQKDEKNMANTGKILLNNKSKQTCNKTQIEEKGFKRKIELKYEINPNLRLSYDIKEIGKYF